MKIAMLQLSFHKRLAQIVIPICFFLSDILSHTKPMIPAVSEAARIAIGIVYNVQISKCE